VWHFARESFHLAHPSVPSYGRSANANSAPIDRGRPADYHQAIIESEGWQAMIFLTRFNLVLFVCVICGLAYLMYERDPRLISRLLGSVGLG